jgi:hypothetical protein
LSQNGRGQNAKRPPWLAPGGPSRSPPSGFYTRRPPRPLSSHEEDKDRYKLEELEVLSVLVQKFVITGRTIVPTPLDVKISGGARSSSPLAGAGVDPCGENL